MKQFYSGDKIKVTDTCVYLEIRFMQPFTTKH